MQIFAGNHSTAFFLNITNTIFANNYLNNYTHFFNFQVNFITYTLLLVAFSYYYQFVSLKDLGNRVISYYNIVS